MTPHLINATRRSISTAMEDLGTACRRLSQAEAGNISNNVTDELIAALDSAASTLTTAGSFVFQTLNSNQPK